MPERGAPSLGLVDPFARPLLPRSALTRDKWRVFAAISRQSVPATRARPAESRQMAWIAGAIAAISCDSRVAAALVDGLLASAGKLRSVDRVTPATPRVPLPAPFDARGVRPTSAATSAGIRSPPPSGDRPPIPLPRHPRPHLHPAHPRHPLPRPPAPPPRRALQRADGGALLRRAAAARARAVARRARRRAGGAARAVRQAHPRARAQVRARRRCGSCTACGSARPRGSGASSGRPYNWAIWSLSVTTSSTTAIRWRAGASSLTR